MFACMRERLINRSKQGDLGEASAMEWLTRQGATVSAPLGHSPDYDVIAEIAGRLLRVQVKTSTFRHRTPNGHERWSASIRTNGGNQSWTGKTKTFDPTKVDALFVLVGDGRRWFIPARAVEGGETISLGGPKYAEYEIDRAQPIVSLVYGAPTDASRIEDSARGSAGVWRAGLDCKFSASIAEWVRIPPPPSPSPVRGGSVGPLKFRRTRISSGHQITIPSVPFRAAGLEVGDRLELTAAGPGRVILERIAPPGDSLPSNGQPQLELG
jgi:PD-(D/E)XK endonuclease